MKFSDRFFVEETSKSLKVVLDKNIGELRFSGRSLPEDAKEFFKPIIDWINEYFKDPNVTTMVDFDIRYYNSASSKMILDLLYVFKTQIDKGLNVIIQWEYDKDDEEMKQAGSDFSELVGIPIELKCTDFV